LGHWLIRVWATGVPCWGGEIEPTALLSGVGKEGVGNGIEQGEEIIRNC